MNFHRLILHSARMSLVHHCPELGSPTSEPQALPPAGAPRPCQPHSSEEKGGKKERKKERKEERKEGRKKIKVIKIKN